MENMDLLSAFNKILKPKIFKDYCPNGLQIEGKKEVNKIVAGVTASESFIDAAIEARADAVIVHHGYFWQGEAPEIVGVKARRIKKLLDHQINLYAYHLPLDAHPEYGNNIQLAHVLDLNVLQGLDPNRETSIGLFGEVSVSSSLDEFAYCLQQKLERVPLVISGGAHSVKRVAWCTGAAQGRIEDAANLGADLYISGEVSEQTYHLAQELGIHYIAAGHHATERYGVKAISEWAAANLGVEQAFIDIDNPI